MAIEWLAGNRIRGTSTERTSTSGFNQISAISGGWKEVGRTTLSSHSSNISVSSLPDKRYYMILYDAIAKATGGSDNNWRFNGDSGNNYAHRKQVNGASDSTGTNQSKIYNMESGGSRHEFGVNYLTNKSDKEKLMIGNNVINWTSGASGDASRKEIVSKWTNTSDSIDEVQLHYSSGRAEANSEVVVLGCDPSDSHTTNFWEELASVDLSGGANANLSSGSFSAKKYLWLQYYVQATSGGPDLKVTFNNDTGTNYTRRRSINGGSDTTNTGQSGLDQDGSLVNLFVNAFIINNSSNEKLGIFNSVREDASGASNAPNRRETATKWVNTSSQITEIDLDVSSSTMTTSSYMRVWGSN